MGRKCDSAKNDAVKKEAEFQRDWNRMLPRLRYNNLSHEMLVKAAKATKMVTEQAERAKAMETSGDFDSPETAERPWAFDCTAEWERIP